MTKTVKYYDMDDYYYVVAVKQDDKGEWIDSICYNQYSIERDVEAAIFKGMEISKELWYKYVRKEFKDADLNKLEKLIEQF